MEFPQGHHGRGEGRGDDDERERWERRRLEEQRGHRHDHIQHHKPDSYDHPSEHNRYQSSTYVYPPPPVRSEEYYGEDIYGHGPPPPPVRHGPYGGGGGGGGVGGVLSGRKTVRVFPKAAENYSLTIRDGNVVLAPSDPRDGYQHWIKDEKFATRVKDEEGFPSFALVNKATGEAIKHSIQAHQPVQLIRYNPEYLDQSVLWAEADDLGEGFRAIRMINNMRLNFDAFKDDQGFHDGTVVGLWEWKKGDNQLWKIVPYCEFTTSQQHIQLNDNQLLVIMFMY